MRSFQQVLVGRRGGGAWPDDVTLTLGGTDTQFVERRKESMKMPFVLEEPPWQAARRRVSVYDVSSPAPSLCADGRTPTLRG